MLKYKHISIYDDSEDNKLLSEARNKFMSLNNRDRPTDRNVIIAALKKYVME